MEREVILQHSGSRGLGGGGAFPVALRRQASTYIEVLRLLMADEFQEIQGYEKKRGFLFV